MRIILFALASIMFSVGLKSQTFQATLKHGSEPNRAVIAYKPDASFTSQPTNLQFTLAVPLTVGARPTMNIISNNYTSHFAANGVNTFQTAEYLTDYLYMINMSPSAFVSKSYTAGQEEIVMEVEFVGNVDASTNVRLVQIPNGMATSGAGSENTLYNYYVEYLGVDRTNQTEQFYASQGGTAVNTPLGYAGYAFVSRGSDPMPVTWVNFTATRVHEHANLEWRVANQVDNDRFEIEVSKNATDFEVLGKVSATVSNDYRFTHHYIDRMNAPVLYYRIKQVDKDGRFSYSVVRKLQVNGKPLSISLAENPVRGSTLKAFIYSGNSGQGTLMISDMSGKMIYKKPVAWTAGASTHHIDLSTQSSGSYVLTLVSEHEKLQVQFVK